MRAGAWPARMTRIDFHFNAPGKVAYTCRLVRKARAAGHKLVIYSGNPALLSELDRALWTFSPLDFLAHCSAQDELAARTPILLAATACETAHHDVLVNLDADRPEFFPRFERMIEVVTGDDDDRGAARERWKYYKERGYAVTHFDIGGTSA